MKLYITKFMESYSIKIMKKERRRCWVVAGCLLVGMASVYAQGRSPKRGVCWDEKTQRLSDATVDKMLPGISWIYTWGESPQGHAAHLGDDEGIVFAPMAWGRNFNEPAIRDYVREHRAVKYLLGFNEPNFALPIALIPFTIFRAYASAHAARYQTSALAKEAIYS